MRPALAALVVARTCGGDLRAASRAAILHTLGHCDAATRDGAAPRPGLGFVHIGAHHWFPPTRDAMLHDVATRHNWTGLLVEPSPHVFEELQRRATTTASPHVPVQAALCARSAPTVPFYAVSPATAGDNMPSWATEIGSPPGGPGEPQDSEWANRIFNVVLASFLIVLAAPVFLGVALLVLVADGRPVLYRGRRLGRNKRPFTMYKFRTLTRGASAALKGQLHSSQHSLEIPCGPFFRDTRLDELPQLWNVLRGEMSLVGPRPERPCFVEDLKQEIPRYALRHKMKAGMTGWAQVHGMRGNTCIQKRVELDLYYIENWSVGLDIKILVKTIFGGFLSPNAY